MNLAALSTTPAATPHPSAGAVAVIIGVVVVLLMLAKSGKSAPAPPPPPPDSGGHAGELVFVGCVLGAAYAFYAASRHHVAAAVKAAPPVVHVTVPPPVTHIVNTHPALQGGSLIAVYVVIGIVILGVVAISAPHWSR